VRDRDILLSRWYEPTFDAEGSWTSPVVTAGFGATELIPSWIAHTPGESYLRIEVHGVTQSGRHTAWYRMGDWAAEDTYFQRTSVAGQRDEDGVVDADTFKAVRPLHGWQVRLTRFGHPTVSRVHLMASGPRAHTAPTQPARALGQVLDVPRYSQLIHVGEYPEWDGGGDSWCSATSTSMVLSYWGAGPGPQDYAWVEPGHADPWVAHAARHTYDRNYEGCGNWPFNTAYAGRFGVEAFVTRLRSLNEAELFIEARIPLVVSASYRDGEVPGLGYETEGHLMVLAGFTEQGDPVLNDPYSGSNAEVRKSVGRAEWEAAWLRTSGGLAYVIHPPSVTLPPAPSQPNW
jgi:Peptidase_C39 like family